MLKGVSFYKDIKIKSKIDEKKIIIKARKHYIQQFALVEEGSSIYFELDKNFIEKELFTFEELKDLKLIEYSFVDKKTIKVQTLFKPKILNRGLEIRERKKKNQAKKRYSITENQKGLIRFVEVKYPKFKRENGKNKFDRMVEGTGVQFENKIYFVEGNFIYCNKKRTKIKALSSSKVTEELKELYSKIKSKKDN